MTKPIERDTIYRCRRFSAETIELCVRFSEMYLGNRGSPFRRECRNFVRRVYKLAIVVPGGPAEYNNSQ